MNESVFVRTIAQHQCVDYELLVALDGSCEVHLEAVDWHVIERRGMDRAAFAAEGITENISA